jgi:hypothetical protein
VENGPGFAFQKTLLTLTLLFASREERDGALVSGMERGVAARSRPRQVGFAEGLFGSVEEHGAHHSTLSQPASEL